MGLFLPLVASEDIPEENGVASVGQYSSISPPGSPTNQEEPFATYFEEKVAVPEEANQVGM